MTEMAQALLCEDQEESIVVERCWSDLTRDILSLILLRLSIVDRSAFKAVCKSWKSITIPRLDPLPPTNRPFYCAPILLMFSPAGNSICKFFHPIYNEFYSINQLFPKDANVRCSSHGWLLMSACCDINGHLSLFFFNPFTKKKIELPQSIYHFQALTFSSPPTSLDWSVLGIFTNNSDAVNIGMLKCGEEVWTYVTLSGGDKFDVCHGVPVLFGGRYYFLDLRGHMGEFNPWIPHGLRIIRPSRSNKRFQRFIRQIFMVEVEGQLLAVFVTHDGMRVRVRKLDLSTETWESVKDLGDNMLYLSETGSFAEIATVRNMANKIYFPKFHGNNGVFYSLATKEYHSYDGKFSSRESYGLRDRCFGTWIQPHKTCLDLFV